MIDTRRPVAARVVTFRGEPAVRLKAGDYDATFLPHLGMLGASLRWRGRQHLSLHGGLDAARGGHTTGMPILAPWANRLAGSTYGRGRMAVDVGPSSAVHRDGNGLPMHGTLVGEHPWTVDELDADDRTASCVASFDYTDRQPLLYAAFPFAHRLEVAVSLSGEGMEVATWLRAVGRRTVPVSFGWHPYYRLPGVGRSAMQLSLPARHELELDHMQIPTGAAHREPAETVALAGRLLDHGYRLGRSRGFTLSGSGASLTTEFDAGYGFAQVYAPTGERFVAIEPMTAATNALRTGDHPTVAPGDSYAATFTVRIG